MKIQYRPKKTEAFVNGETWLDIDHTKWQDCEDALFDEQWHTSLIEAGVWEVDLDDSEEDIDDAWEDLDLDDYFEFRIEYEEGTYPISESTASEWLGILFYPEGQEDRAEAFVQLCGDTYYPSEFNGLTFYESYEDYGRMLYDNDESFNIPDDALNHFDFGSYGEEMMGGGEFAETNAGYWFK